MVLSVVEYLDDQGESPFGSWFSSLDAPAAARIAAAVSRMEQGNFSAAKSIGGGVMEYRIDAGPGYRIYFGRDGATLVILLAGGTKRRQQRDIDSAKARWSDYKKRKRETE